MYTPPTAYQGSNAIDSKQGPKSKPHACVHFSSFFFIIILFIFCLWCEQGLAAPRELACGETLRVLTHYNRPVHVDEKGGGSSSHAAPRPGTQRRLTGWITDCLLASPLRISTDYFRWWVNKISESEI